MKKRMLCAVAAMAICLLFAGVGMSFGQAAEKAATPAQASASGDVKVDPKDLTGIWQGTLQAGPGLRTVLKIARGGDGKYAAQFYSIDQGGQPIPVSALTLEGSNVKYAIVAVGGNYQGTLSADGKTIDGQWSQGPGSMPLKLMRTAPETAWEIPKPPPPPKPMAADADPSFEVATVKPSDPNARGKGFGIRGRTLSTRNTSLDDLIEYAYDVHLKQIVDGPAWMDENKFDLTAVPDKEGDPSSQQWKSMLKKLLADRFQLKFHHDKRELSVFVMSVAKDGPKNLEKSVQDNDKFSIPIRPAPGGLTMLVANGNMGDFSGFGLQGAVLDRPVLDQTGITGRYNFKVTWAPSGSEFGGRMPAPPPSDNPPPSLFTAMQEQLGLKLDATKAATDVMVIDKAEKPSAN
jgi:uncharacterized protein (TIGR03435 family)